MFGILLALGASVCWGSGDFLGGLTTRRASLWAVVVGSQLVGLVGATIAVVAAGRAWPGLAAVAPALAGGLAGAVALAAFYRALAIGTMSIVAPITATSAVIPFAVGIAGGERPTALQGVGLVLAAAGVLLASSERGTGAPRTADPITMRRSILLALVAAAGIGIMLTGFNATAEHDALWAVLGGRIASVTAFTVFFVVRRPPATGLRPAWPAIASIGVLDTGANALFSLATTVGFLSIVSVIGSLYPVVTVVLAYVLLHERIARHQQAGVIGALAGVALIAAG